MHQSSQPPSIAELRNRLSNVRRRHAIEVAAQRGRLEETLQAGGLIAVSVANTTLEPFSSDTMKQDAVIRRIEIIGEAAARRSEETRNAIPAPPLRQTRGMRNIAAHDSANVNVQIACQAARLHVSQMVQIREEFFAR